VIWTGMGALHGVWGLEKLAELGGLCHDYGKSLRIRKDHLQGLHENNFFVFALGKAWM